MSTSRSMTPLSVVLNRIAEKGYHRELKISEDGARLEDDGEVYSAEQLTIIKVYRFEGESDPGDMAVIYLVHTDDEEKAYLMNAYGPYSDQDNPYYDDFIKDVPIDELEEEI
jgi:hypothetical protein